MTKEELDKYLKDNILRITNAKSKPEIRTIIEEQNKIIEDWVKGQVKNGYK